MQIALDAMGGDYAPTEIVKGAVRAARELEIPITLVGNQEAIRQELGEVPDGIEIVHASEVIEMHEHPAAAVRRKRDASVVVAAKLVAEGKADAMISAGNSGAAMAVAMMRLGRIAGIERPAIATMMPGRRGATVLLDAGANVDCSPENLVDFATMGSIYAEQVLKVQNPKVGVLSIGEEPTKGNELTKATHELLKGTSLNFAGNIEGRHLFTNEVDVVVCDGFVGNVALKVSEGMAEFMLAMIRQEAGEVDLSRLLKKVDYAEYGGAPLLGVNGICVISHGRSDARAIFSAVKAASQAVANDVVGRIRAALLKPSGEPTA